LRRRCGWILERPGGEEGRRWWFGRREIELASGLGSGISAQNDERVEKMQSQKLPKSQCGLGLAFACKKKGFQMGAKACWRGSVRFLGDVVVVASSLI